MALLARGRGGILYLKVLLSRVKLKCRKNIREIKLSPSALMSGTL
jgi:hypothetical protein